MKKMFYIFIPIAILCIFASIKGVNAEDNTYKGDSYEVTIPSEVSFDSGKQNKEFNVSTTLAPYNKLKISVKSQNSYNLKCGNTYSMGYTLIDKDGKSIENIEYSTKNVTDGSEKNFSTTLNAKIPDNTVAQVSGTYSDVLTFKMSCVESYPDGQAGLTFDANGGTIDTDRKVLDIGAEYGDLPEATRTGYTFAGWYKEKDAGQQVAKNDILTTNTTIYAHWTANTYTVKYDNNSSLHNQATGGMNDDTMTYDTNKQLKKCTFKNNDTGSHFIGWNTVANGSGVQYDDEQNVKNLCSKSNGEITLYAQWTYDNIVEVHFEDVEGNMDIDTRKVIAQSLPKGQRVTWSVNDLVEYQENPNQWNKQWIKPDNGTVNYTTENESKTITINIMRQWYYLDLNGNWYDKNNEYVSGGGNLKWNNEIAATANVYINGVLDEKHGKDVYDYFQKQRYGSTFKIIITMKDNFEFKGAVQTDKQPLSKVTSNINECTISGIVTGERYVDNSKNETPYYATTVAAKIKSDKIIKEPATTDLKEIKLSEVNNDEEIVSD